MRMYYNWYDNDNKQWGEITLHYQFGNHRGSIGNLENEAQNSKYTFMYGKSFTSHKLISGGLKVLLYGDVEREGLFVHDPSH